MLYILHGEDNVSSRQKLTSLVDNSKSVTRIDGKKQSLEDILNAFENKSLFTEKRTVVIESFSKIKPIEPIVEATTKLTPDKETVIILWENDDLDKRTLSKFKTATVFQFPFPKYFFAFLDGLNPKGAKASLATLNNLLTTYEPEQVLYSMIKRVRQLILVKSNSYGASAEFARMGDWQISKLKSQANLWSVDQLKALFVKLAETDELIKTSGLSVPLSKHLDIILLSDLH